MSPEPSLMPHLTENQLRRKVDPTHDHYRKRRVPNGEYSHHNAHILTECMHTRALHYLYRKALLQVKQRRNCETALRSAVIIGVICSFLGMEHDVPEDLRKNIEAVAEDLRNDGKAAALAHELQIFCGSQLQKIGEPSLSDLSGEIQRCCHKVVTLGREFLLSKQQDSRLLESELFLIEDEEKRKVDKDAIPQSRSEYVTGSCTHAMHIYGERYHRDLFASSNENPSDMVERKTKWCSESEGDDKSEALGSSLAPNDEPDAMDEERLLLLHESFCVRAMDPSRALLRDEWRFESDEQVQESLNTNMTSCKADTTQASLFYPCLSDLLCCVGPRTKYQRATTLKLDESLSSTVSCSNTA